MSHTLFTVEEENLICAFDTGSRFRLMADINGALPVLGEQGNEMREIAEATLIKLDGMTDAEFGEMIFTPAYDDDESEV